MNDVPFVFGKAVTGENFTDRVKETKRLSANFIHGVNTILISPRRWGKTSLIKRVAETVQSDSLKIVFIDIFSCRSIEEFYSRFAECVIKQTASKSEEWFENIKSFLLRFSPKVTLSAGPVSDISFGLDIKSQKEDISEILQLPERIARKKKCRIVVCIDEFQQIGEFDDSLSFQKHLRTVWQHQQLTSYCMFGSKKHMMTRLFENRSNPFYKFGDVIFLNKIPTEDWVDFIVSRYRETGKEISRELATEICRKVDNQSNYVQQLSWILWINTEKVALPSGLEQSYEELLDHNSMLYENMTESLTSTQLNFLKAITQGVHKGFSSKEILSRFNLGTSANIRRIKDALIKNDLIETEGADVTIPDPIFREWLRRKTK